MSEYGEVINCGYDPTKNYIYDSFSDYYKCPTLTKIKNVDKYSVYMTKIYAMLGNAHRYLILFIEQDHEPIGNTKSMKNCEWVSLQTRTLEDQYHLKPHVYTSEKKPPLNQKINIVSQDEKKSIYNCETLPLTITLLHTRKNTKYQYQQTGTIVSALETFQTVISFNNV